MRIRVGKENIFEIISNYIHILKCSTLHADCQGVHSRIRDIAKAVFERKFEFKKSLMIYCTSLSSSLVYSFLIHAFFFFPSENIYIFLAVFFFWQCPEIIRFFSLRVVCLNLQIFMYIFFLCCSLKVPQYFLYTYIEKLGFSQTNRCAAFM